MHRDASVAEDSKISRRDSPMSQAELAEMMVHVET
jgi:hypothetical protein